MGVLEIRISCLHARCAVFDSFFAAYIVYIDWILGTPALLYNLATLIHCPTSNIIQLITYDIMMIGCGFIGAFRFHGPTISVT